MPRYSHASCGFANGALNADILALLRQGFGGHPALQAIAR
jgi:hypothetical protein